MPRAVYFECYMYIISYIKQCDIEIKGPILHLIHFERCQKVKSNFDNILDRGYAR